MADPTFSLTALSDAALLFEADGRLLAINDAARALAPERLESLWAPVVARARECGIGRAVVPDGDRDGVLVATARRTDDGRVLLLLVDARDVAAEERRSFITSLLHELRNLAFALTINAEEHTDLRGDAARTISDRITRLSRGLEEWVEPALERPTTYSLVELVEEIAERVGHQQPATTFRVIGDRDARSTGRRARIGRAIHHVLDNAAGFSPPGAPIEITIASSATRHAIVIRDRGPGLPRGAEGQIFSALFRRRKGGVGLGLSIARRIVADDGGAMRAHDAEDGGVVVTIELPRAP